MTGGNPVYSPLPQSNSESDDYSEEELHTFNERIGIITRLGKHQNQSRSQIMLNSKSPDVINYKQWDDDKDLGVTSSGFQSGSDHIPPFTTSKNNADSLSPARKLCFTFSIFMCIFTTVFFLWIMPCETDHCPRNKKPTNNHDKVVSMQETLSHVELFGPISIAPSVAKYKTENLVFLFRKSFTEEKDGKPSPGYGVVSVLADSKEPSWWVYLDREPSDIDCNVIDVNLDGINDCLVNGKDSLLRAIESSSGKELWDFDGGGALALNRCNFQFPLILPDLDGDGVRELLSVCPVDERVGSVGPHSHNYFFLLISGRRGASMGKPAEIKNCYSIVDVTLEKEYVISYKCLNWTNRESVNMLSLKDFLLNVDVTTSEKWTEIDGTHSRISQHKAHPDGNTLYLDGRRFTLKNKGQCPGRCSMFVKIDDEKSGRINHTTLPVEIENSYGMIPVGLKRDRFTGFVFKYWLWEPDEEGEAEYLGKRNASNNGQGRENGRRSNLRSFRESESLEHAMFGGDMPESPRVKRTPTRTSDGPETGNNGNGVKKENLTFHRIVERIFLITFNETDRHVINTSQCDIVQICGHRGVCQPDARFQRQSLYIANVDSDNFQELISYSSSFVNRRIQESTSEGGVWELQSSVEIIKLESQLDKVYKEKN